MGFMKKNDNNNNDAERGKAGIDALALRAKQRLEERQRERDEAKRVDDAAVKQYESELSSSRQREKRDVAVKNVDDRMMKVKMNESRGKASSASPELAAVLAKRKNESDMGTLGSAFRKRKVLLSHSLTLTHSPS